MDSISVYAIAAGSSLIILILIKILRYFGSWTNTISVFISRYFVYPYLLSRHRFAGPWTPYGILVHSLYMTINLLCLLFPKHSMLDVGRRAGTLSIVNMTFLLLGIHLAFTADILGIYLRHYQMFHRAVGWMTTILSVIHVVMNAILGRKDTDAFSKIAIISLAALLLLFRPIFRQFAYEILLRIHQGTAALCIYATWIHLKPHPIIPQLYLYILLGVFSLTFSLQSIIFLRQNGAWSSYGCPQAVISCGEEADEVSGENPDKKTDTTSQPVKVRLILPRPMKVCAGQYVNICILFATWSSWAQSHPFIVTSWSSSKQNVLDLYIEPQHGLTADLHRLASNDTVASLSFPAFVSGPHGIHEPVHEYETVLIVASGFGWAAVIPYLKQLLYGYNSRTSRTRRVHFVWQLGNLDIAIATQSCLNDLLNDDTLGNGYILTISIHDVSRSTGDNMRFGNHKRALVYGGPANLDDIVQSEIFSRENSQTPSSQERDMLILASVPNRIRDELRRIVRQYLHKRVKLTELEFQPK